MESNADKMESKADGREVMSPRNGRRVLIRYYIFVGLKWFQVFVCFMTILVAVIFELIFITTGKKAWRNWKQEKKPDVEPDKCECNLSVLSLRFWWDVIFWLFVELSIPGLIGAAGEIMFCQVIYTAASIPTFPYCVIPFLVLGGLCKGWNIPPDPLTKG